MRSEHLRAIDLNLLPVLEALLRHRSVTAAADAIHLSQPATSRALARLRALLDDPLLVRGPRGFVLTARAASLRPELAEILDGIGSLITESPLDPAAEVRSFRVAMSDAHAVLLLPALIARLAQEAPHVSVVVVPYGADLPARMATGEIDIVFALATSPLPPGTVSRPLAIDKLAVVVGSRHPKAGGRWEMADYARWPSIAISLIGDGASEMDTLLARVGVSRRLAAVVPNFVTALSVVGATNAVTTVSRAAAERFRTTFDLSLLDPPFAETELPMTLVTAVARRGDRLLDWLCSVLGEQAQSAFAIAD